MLEQLKALFLAPQRKASRTARVIALEGGGRARWTPCDRAAPAAGRYLLLSLSGFFSLASPAFGSGLPAGVSLSGFSPRTAAAGGSQ